MKKAFGWSITAIGIICLVFFLGILFGRRSVAAPRNTNQQTESFVQEQTDPVSDTLININTADAALLQQLPGIGEVLAQRIIHYRNEHGPFSDIRELIKVDGIGDGKLINVLPYICIEDK